MVAHETAIFMRCNHWLYLLARRQSYYAIPVSIMAGSTADRIDALRGLAVSVIARISALWLCLITSCCSSPFFHMSEK